MPTDQQRKIGELIARGYDEDQLNSYGVAQLDELHKKEFPDKYTVADDAIQNQDFSKDAETNANLYKIGDGPGIFKPAARREYESMQADAAANRAAEGNTEQPTRMNEDKWLPEKLADGLNGLKVDGNPSSGGSNLPSFGDTTDTTGESNNGGSNNSTGANTGSNGNSNNSNNVTEAATEDPRTNYQLKGIYQAYKDGDIDASTAEYMAADVISNFAKDLAAGQANIAAIYNGGSPSQVGNSKSLWDKRNEEMAKQGISAEAATVKGSDKNYERLFQDKNLTSLGLDNEFKQLKNFAPRELAKIANDPKQPDAMRKAAMVMVANATGNDMGAEEYAALLGADFLNNARNLGIGGAIDYLIGGKK